MVRKSRLATLVLAAAAVAVLAPPASAADDYRDLHAYMVGKIGDSCGVDRERLARFEPRMIVVHAVVDQTSLPSGWARAKVVRPILGGLNVGAQLGMSHRRHGIGGARGANLVKGKEYLISMFRYGGVLVVDRALECSGA